MATTVEQHPSAEYLTDKHIVITGKHCMVRQLPIPSTWKWARMGFCLALSPDNPTPPTPPTFPATIANIEIWMGFCKSGVNHPGLNPWTNADTHIGVKFGATAGPSGVGETMTFQNYSNGDGYYTGATGMWFWKVFNGTATGLTSTTQQFGMKALNNYSTAKTAIFMEMEDQGANWKVTSNYISRGSGGFNCGTHYGQFVKAIKAPLISNTGAIHRICDQGLPYRNHMIVTTAQDNTRGRPDSIYLLYRDHNSTGTRLIISAMGAACGTS